MQNMTSSTQQFLALNAKPCAKIEAQCHLLVLSGLALKCS